MFLQGLKRCAVHRSFIVMLLMATVTLCTAEPLADGAGKFLGNITARWNAPDNNNFISYWNQVTPENEGKWGNVERSQNRMDWSGLDSAYAFARRNRLPFKQHTLVWGKQEPSWIGRLSKEEQLKELQEWFSLFAKRYPDVEYIDVVNEPINHPASYREALGGEGETGYDWVIRAFEEARAVLPNAKLLINEYHVIEKNGPTDGIIYLATLLKQRGLIDGIGLQSHYFSYANTSPELLKSILDKLAATGIPIYSSEFDISGSDSVQLSLYKTYFPIFWEHPAVQGITLWGWMQDHTWEGNTYLIGRNGTERPAFTWLKEYIAQHKEVVASRLGKTQKRATDRLNATANGATLQITLPGEGFYSLTCTNLIGKVVASWPAAWYPHLATVALPTKLPRGLFIVSAVTEDLQTTAFVHLVRTH